MPKKPRKKVQVTMPLSSLSAYDALNNSDRPKLFETVLRLVADRIVPPEDGRPGASESGAFDYLWKQLSPGGDLEKQREVYEVALLDEMYYVSERTCGAAFMDLFPNQQGDVLRAFEKQNPRFFARMVEHVQEGFYTSQAAFDMIGWKVTA